MPKLFASLVLPRLRRSARVGDSPVSEFSQAEKGKAVDLGDAPSSSSSRENRIDFFSRDMPTYWLSNSSEHAVVFDGSRYPTAEHLFQCVTR